MNESLISIKDGLTTLGPGAMSVLDALERRFLRFAWEDSKAIHMRFPPLMRAEDLDRFDYFKNFPHMCLCVSGITEPAQEVFSKGRERMTTVASKDLASAEYVLPPAACYNIYLHLKDAALAEPAYVTTVAQCYRREAAYEGLRRLRGFTMREIVCIGSMEDVKAHLGKYKEKIQSFISTLGLPVKLAFASDPFFDRMSERALAAQIFPTKEEFLYKDELAFASLNFHRNFFGERCGIKINGETAYTGCVAFGLERWLHALLEHHAGDTAAIVRALDAA
jgi:seryl-tRNA synthetase